MHFSRFFIVIAMGMNLYAKTPIKGAMMVPMGSCSSTFTDALCLRGIFPKTEPQPAIIQFLELCLRHPDWWSLFPETMRTVQKIAEKKTLLTDHLSAENQRKLRNFFHCHPPKTANGWILYLKKTGCSLATWKKTFYAFLPKASLQEFKEIYPLVCKYVPTISWSIDHLPIPSWIQDGTQKPISDSRNLLDLMSPKSVRLRLLSRLLARTKDSTIDADYEKYIQKNPQDSVLSRAMILSCLRCDSAEKTYTQRFQKRIEKEVLKNPSSWVNLDIRIMMHFLQEGQEEASKGNAQAAKKLYTKGVSIPIIAHCEKARDAHWTKGFLYFVGLKNYTKALYHFLQSSHAFSAHSLDPKNIEKRGSQWKNIEKNGLLRHDVRALFWCGLCCEYLKKYTLAKIYYEKAAPYGTFLYGKLACRKLKRPIALHFANPKPTAKDWKSHGQKEALRVIHAWQSDANGAFPAYETTLALCKDLMALAKTSGDHARALQLIGMIYPGYVVEAAKKMAKKSHHIFQAQYPILEAITQSDRALIHSIILAESSFVPSAFSWDGGIGIMQIMPKTAVTAAKEMGIPLDMTRLRKEASYQIQMGAFILNQYIQKMHGLYLPGIAAYNAGIMRATSWVDRTPISEEDGLIWVQSIPFQITRHYVLSVIESYLTYRQLMKRPVTPSQWIDLWRVHPLKENTSREKIFKKSL